MASILASLRGLTLDSVVSSLADSLFKIKDVNYSKICNSVRDASQKVFSQIKTEWERTHPNAQEINALKERLIAVIAIGAYAMTILGVALAVFSSLTKGVIVGGLGWALQNATEEEIRRRYSHL